ncbi:unnamed protein product [Closterium sp. NIES-54]
MSSPLSPHPVDPLPPQGPDPSGVSQVDPLPGTVHVEVAVDSGAGRGAASGGATSRGAASGGAEPGDAEPGGVEPEGAESEGAGSGGAEPAGVESGGAEPEGVEPGGAESGGAEPRGTASSGAIGAGDSSAGDTGARGAGFPAGSGGIGGAAAVGPGGGTVRPRRTLFPCFSRFLPASALPAPSPYTAQTGGLTKCRELASRPASPVCTGRRFPRPRPPLVPGTHAMALRPSSVPLRVPLPPPPESSLPANPDPESDRGRAASPTVSLLLATVVTQPSFESTAAFALSVSAKPPSVGGECALGTDVLEDMQEDFECLAAAVPRFASMLLAPEGDPDAPDIPTPRSYAEAITGPYSSRWQAAMDAEMASWKSTGTYIDAVPPSRANITFSPTPKMTTLWVLLHVAARRDYELHSPDFSTAFLQGSLHEEIWLRHPPGFTGSFLAGTQWSLRRPVYGVRQAPHEWHDTLRTTLAALGFTPSTADPLLFLRTDTSLPPFYFLVYVDDLDFASADTEALTFVKSELQKRHTCTDLGELRSYLGLQITRDRARRTITMTQSHMVHQVLQRFGFQFSSPQPTPLSTSHSLSAPPSDDSVEPSGPYPELVGCLISSCEAEIYARAMAAQELRWLTYLLTNLGKQPRLPPILYVDNKAMIALCQEHRLEHRTKHIALRYFLARELQQRGQLRLAYVATRANTADIFTKALPPGNHQRFSTKLGLVPTLPHLLTA